MFSAPGYKISAHSTKECLQFRNPGEIKETGCNYGKKVICEKGIQTRNTVPFFHH